MGATRITRETSAPADVVWNVLTDLEHTPEVLSAVTHVQRLDDAEGFDVGTRWAETRALYGREATEQLTVTSMDPGRGYTVEASSRWARYRTSVALEASHDGGTWLSMTFETEPTGLLGRLVAATVGRLAAGVTRRALEQDLDEIVAAVEDG